MPEAIIALTHNHADLLLAGFFGSAKGYLLIFVGFSLVVFFHELGHFVAAKLCDVRVDKFAVGFGREIFGFTRGETRYSFNILPLGGYVKMLGQEDFTVDKSGEWKVKEDPRAFTYKSVGRRMIIVSSGVAMNMLFAAVTFALVFMIGMKSISSEIGNIMPGMPASRAGLQVGDKIIKVNDDSIADYSDLKMAVILADPDQPLVITYQRQDSLTGQTKTGTVRILPEMNPDQNMLQIGVMPPKTNVVGLVFKDPMVPANEQLEEGDEIVAVNGQLTNSFWRVRDQLAELRGEYGTLTVERPADQDGSKRGQLQRRWRARQFFLPSGRLEEESGHLLGLAPRRQVAQVTESSRADCAGIETSDIIARWGGQIAPTLDEINKSRRENPENDIRVTIYRPGQGEKSVIVRPKAPAFWSQGTAPVDGLNLLSQENDQLIVADIVTNVTADLKTPAATLKGLMPRGSLITKVNGQPVKTWDQLSRLFTKLAGTQITLAWSYQGQPEQSGEIHVPHTLGTTFDLPAIYRIISINELTYKEVELGGRRVSVSANNWIGAREILRDFVGKQVSIVYQGSLDPTQRTAVIDRVTPEMLDTWVQRIGYDVDNVFTGFEATVVKVRNPFKAMLIGVRKTYYFIEQVYLTMQRMIFTRSVTVEQISGPVGIFKTGSQFAEAGLAQLLYFLALISANLAVINFLPLPIFDGGVFIFLLIEKIKGSPISMKVQMATQLIGLALILGMFLFVTILDVQKW